MENFQCSSALPNMKNNCIVLFLCQLYLLLPPATKLGQGNVFTSICDSVQGGMSCMAGGGMHGRGACMAGGVCVVGGVCGWGASVAGGCA